MLAGSLIFTVALLYAFRKKQYSPAMLLTDYLLGLSLAIDAFAASLAIGLKEHRLARRWFLLIPLLFGLFQSMMPWLGWQFITVFSAAWINRIDHWIAFILLVGIGANMLRLTLRPHTETEVAPAVSLSTVLSLAVATSIDALAVGFTLPAISPQPVQTITIIGVITTVLCFIGLIGTTYIPKKITRPAEITASVILIGLGCKILLSNII